MKEGADPDEVHRVRSLSAYTNRLASGVIWRSLGKPESTCRLHHDELPVAGGTTALLLYCKFLFVLVCTTQWGTTPLGMCEGNARITKLLLDSGASPNPLGPVSSRTSMLLQPTSQDLACILRRTLEPPSSATRCFAGRMAPTWESCKMWRCRGLPTAAASGG